MFKPIARLWVALVLGWAESASAGWLSPVTVDGRDWLQPVDFFQFSWNDINAVCNANAGGVCSGSLGGNDLTGWMWASVDDVNALFNYYLPGDPLGPGPSWFSDNSSITFAEAFFASGFIPSYSYSGVDSIVDTLQGSTRTVAVLDEFPVAYLGIVQWYIVPQAGSHTQDLATSFYLGSFDSDGNYGAFMVRDPQASSGIPIPATIPLVGLGLAALCFSRRKRNQQS